MLEYNDQNHADVDALIEYAPDSESDESRDKINDSTENIADVAKIVKALQCQKCDFVTSSIEILLKHFKTHKKSSKTASQSEQPAPTPPVDPPIENVFVERFLPLPQPLDDHDNAFFDRISPSPQPSENDNIFCEIISPLHEPLDSDNIFCESTSPLPQLLDPPIYDNNSNESYEEILVCALCYGQYDNAETLRNHMIDDHECTPIMQKESTPVRTLPVTLDDDGGAGSSTSNYCPPLPELDDRISEESEIPSEMDEMAPVPFKEFKYRLTESYIYKCTVKRCFYKFESREKLELHLKCHCSTETDKVRDFKCIDCEINWKTWRTCSWHMWKVHAKDVDLLKCPICTYKTLTAVKVWRHMRVHGRWRSKVLKRKHPNKENKDKNTSRWYTQKTCEICGRIFANSRTLSKHVKVVHNRIKPFICNVCGRKSARKSTWIVHMRQHTGERPYQCKSCPFRAGDPSVLTKHEMRHTNTFSYKCNLCEYSSIQSNSFKYHVKLYHPEEFKKISCDQCNYISINADVLEAHKKDHKTGLIKNEDSLDARVTTNSLGVSTNPLIEKPTRNVEISSDCFLPLESTDSIAHDPPIDTGGVTIPAHSEDTQFPPAFMHS